MKIDFDNEKYWEYKRIFGDVRKMIIRNKSLDLTEEQIEELRSNILKCCEYQHDFNRYLHKLNKD